MTAVDTVTLVRPRLRRDVLFTQTPTGVLFHDANGGFHIRSTSAYRFVSALVPYLDGSNSVADLCEVLGEQRAPMLEQLVRNLIERGFARDVATDEPDSPADLPDAVAARFEAQVNYVDHYVDRAHSRFAGFRTTRVAVLGADTTARWCALGLIRNGAATVGLDSTPGDPSLRGVRDEAAELTAVGCPVDVTALGPRTGPRTWADLEGWDVVVSAGPDAARQALSLLAEGVPTGRVVLPVMRHGSRVVVGPLARTETDPCVGCAALRLGANGDPGDAADFWFGLRQALGARAAADTLSPGPLAAMVGNLLAYEIFRLRTGALRAETDGHVLVQDVDSLDVSTERLHVHPLCSLHPQPPVPAEFGRVEIGLPAVPSVEDHDAADTALAELSRRTFAFVAPNVGLFTRFDDDALTQTPVKVSRVRLGLGHGSRRVVAALDLHTVLRARLAALRSAATLYAEHVAVCGPPTAEAAPAARTMDEPFCATGIATAHPGRAVGSSLVDGAVVDVPVAAVHPTAATNAYGGFVRTSAGAAAGDTWSEAVTRGLLSAIAYDAVLRVLRGTVGARSIPADALTDHTELNFLLRSAANLDAAVEIIDIPAVAPVVLARSGDHVAVRAGMAWTTAATDALLDLVGTLQVCADEQGGTIDLGDPLLPELDPRAIRPVGEAPARPGERRSGEEIVAALRAAGQDAVAVDTTPGDLRAAGLRTARVVLGVAGGYAASER